MKFSSKIFSCDNWKQEKESFEIKHLILIQLATVLFLQKGIFVGQMGWC